jgi:acyloxyacyl hydrolase
MRFSSLLFVATAFLAVSLLVGRVTASENGGMGCAACTLVVGLVEQAAQIHNRTLTEEAEALCGYLPDWAAKVCVDIFAIIGPIVFPIIVDSGSADVACNIIELCKNETAVCRLFPLPKAARTEEEYLGLLESYKAKRTSQVPKIDVVQMVCDRSPRLCKLLKNFLGITSAGEPHLPLFDLDGDRFSDYAELRGYDWRGKDCNDLDKNVFPGRLSADDLSDNNCNGIAGIDTSTFKSYESEWCDNTGAVGIAMLGDSATAHFRIPTDFLTASQWNHSTFECLVPLLENEGDWPMLSWGTGHVNTSKFAPAVHGPMQSLYNLLRERNQCNHNDFQNIGVNGAASGNLVEWATLLNRNSTAGAPVKPLMIFFSMIGNDVCGHNHDFSHMTTPDVYYKNVLDAVYTVDAIVPKGSTIILVPLVDGRVLYNEMHDRIHPVGETNNDVTYKDVYNFLNCLDTSPCWGWMNSNETVRNTTWAIASSLNAQLPRVVNDTLGKLKNVVVHFPGNVIDEALKNSPVPRWQLIEPVDGFHPSQMGNALIAQNYWWALGNLSLLPPVNPNNAAILAKFGSSRP